MLRLRPVVLDIEDFRHKRSVFIIKQLSVCTHDYIDTVSFRPPSSIKILSSSEHKFSSVVYFTEIFIIVFLLGISLVKLVFFKLDCEKSTFWFSFLS